MRHATMKEYFGLVKFRIDHLVQVKNGILKVPFFKIGLSTGKQFLVNRILFLGHCSKRNQQEYSCICKKSYHKLKKFAHVRVDTSNLQQVTIPICCKNIKKGTRNGCLRKYQ